MAAPKNQEVLGGTIWKLQCYARFQTKDVQCNVEEGRNQPNVSGTWKYSYPSAEGSLTLSLQEGCQLVISNGSTILNETRRFRVKFPPEQNLTSDEYCAVCVKRLSTVLMIKDVAADDKSAPAVTLALMEIVENSLAVK